MFSNLNKKIELNSVNSVLLLTKKCNSEKMQGTNTEITFLVKHMHFKNYGDSVGFFKNISVFFLKKSLKCLRNNTFVYSVVVDPRSALIRLFFLLR